ncbi:hypothetical protein [Actinoplanes sp. L3-i22]|uniref:hypothetical protein n=1 Tax=Actinoplanes sp. L3-i22 TaxID=2836373 RepID=UPI001C8437F3|nr:hypothetical protein [Actinoplanes sp. L3-i22]
MLSLLTLNLQAAALARTKRILGWLAQRDDHAIVLTEPVTAPTPLICLTASGMPT